MISLYNHIISLKKEIFLYEEIYEKFPEIVLGTNNVFELNHLFNKEFTDVKMINSYYHIGCLPYFKIKNKFIFRDKYIAISDKRVNNLYLMNNFEKLKEEGFTEQFIANLDEAVAKFVIEIDLKVDFNSASSKLKTYLSLK